MKKPLKILISFLLAILICGAKKDNQSRAILTPAPQSGGSINNEPVFFTGKARIKASVDKMIITVGELINYEMEVWVPKGYAVAIPPPGAQLGEFMIRNYQIPKPAKKGDMLKQEFKFKITAYTTGDLVIPPVPVLIEKDGKLVAEILTQEIKIRIAPITRPDELEIKDIKPPLALPFNYLPWLLGIGGFLGLVGIGLGVAFAVSRLKRKPMEFPEELPPPYELALKELDELEQSGLLEKGEIDAYYTKLSEIIRKYIGLRFQFYSLECTTTEILEELKASFIEHMVYKLVQEFLQETDLVKFARYVPSASEQKEIMRKARKIVELTHEEEEKEIKKVASSNV